jgi:hypothetical protein
MDYGGAKNDLTLKDIQKSIKTGKFEHRLTKLNDSSYTHTYFSSWEKESEW